MSEHVRVDDAIVRELAAIVGSDHLVVGEQVEEYAHDTTFLEHAPLCAVRPSSTEQTAEIVRVCVETATPIVARGRGTSVVGGPVPLAGGVVISLERLTRIEVDAPNMVAVVGAGVITADLDRAAKEHGLMYPPDPGSVELSTIGGNVACNAGGMRCLKYGVTADYVIGLTVVLADGRVLKMGGRLRKRASGYRLIQLFVGSEGTLGIVTEIIVKLIPLPRHHATAMIAFKSIEDAGAAVARALAAGHLPSAVEILDRESLKILEDRLPPGFNPDAGAALIVEQDGNDKEFVDLELMSTVEVLGGFDNWIARSSIERERLWDARRNFVMILMALPNSFLCEDVAVPVSQIPDMVRRIEALGHRTGLRIATVGHAGDGNLHPTFLFTEEQRPLISAAIAQLLRDAIELGGTISAEHGLGVLKRDYAEAEHGPLAISLMRQLKQVLDPEGLLNPHKVFPEHPADDNFLNNLPGWIPDPHRRTRKGEIVL